MPQFSEQYVLMASPRGNFAFQGVEKQNHIIGPTDCLIGPNRLKFAVIMSRIHAGRTK